MTFIDMLQQGGYILPQYNSAQQTYAVPNNGMQALQTMMQVDQQGQNRYLQGEQLNLQKAQATQSFISSTIQNELNRKTQERLQKQMDLSNEKLKFQMQKEILDDIDEQRKYMKDNFLGRDQIKMQESMQKMGLDPNSILGRMKGNMNLENYMNEAFAVRAFYASQKDAFSNMQKYGQAKEHIAKSTENLKRAEEFAKKGWLDDTAYQKYFKSLNKATADTVGFENGSVPDIDFSNKDWSFIAGFPDFLDEIQMEKTLEIEEQVKKAKMEEDLADAKYKTANAAMLTGTLDSRIKLNEAKATLDIAKANNEINDMQFEQEQRVLQNADWELWKKENPDATATERSNARNNIYSSKPTAAAGPLSVDEAYVKSLETGDTYMEDKLYNYKTANNNKSTSVTYTTDKNGNTIGVTDKQGVTNWGTHRTDKEGNFLDGTYGGRVLTREQLEAAGATIHDDGSIDIEQSKLIKLIPAITSKGNKLNSNNIKAFFGDANATMIEDTWGTDNLWTIKGKGPLPQNTTGNSSSNVNPKFRNNTGTSSVPKNAKDAL